MNYFQNMVNSQLILFMYLAVGVYCKKKNYIDENTKKKLVDFILQICLPCMVFQSFHTDLNPEILAKTFYVFLVSALVAVVSFVLGSLLYNHYSQDKKPILQYSTFVNNSGFLGMPLVESVYGTEGLFYASIFVIPNRIMMWTAGISLFSKAGLKSMCKNILFNPAIIAVYLGIIRRLFSISIPDFLDVAVARIGGITSPLSMIIIGTMLVGIDKKKLLDISILYLAFVRLILIPTIGLILMIIFRFDSLLIGVSLILTAMPAGSTGALLATKYGANEDFASGCIVVTTIFSLITIPIWMLILYFLGKI